MMDAFGLTGARFLGRFRRAVRLSLAMATLAPAGCVMFRANPLDANRGAVVLVFDLRTAGNLKSLCETLSANDARATFFANGQIDRGQAGQLMDLRAEGHEIGLSGLNGVDPQAYSLTCGQQKYFQDEIVTQVLAARRHGLTPRHFLLRYRSRVKPETLKLPSFIASKGFARVVDVMPDYVPMRAVPASELASPVLHAYVLKPDSFDRAQIASLAKRDEVLVVAPDGQVLSEILEEARAQGVPFATLSDLE